MRWTQYHLIGLVLLGLLLGVATVEDIPEAVRGTQTLNLCGLIGKHIPPPNPGHDPRRPSAPINQIITRIDQSLGDLCLAQAQPDNRWNLCDSVARIHR